jgi:hypothetical protein
MAKIGKTGIPSCTILHTSSKWLMKKLKIGPTAPVELEACLLINQPAVSL